MLPLWLLMTVLSLAVSLGQRRIMDGIEVNATSTGTLPSYVVYLVEQRSQPESWLYADGAWMCAGAIVHESYVLTSGACLADINQNKKRSKTLSPLWVISGTSHYVFGAVRDEDALKCVNKYKRVVTKTYIPYSANFSYLPIERWVSLDIGLAQVDDKFTFDGLVGEGCDYAATKVEVNFEEAHQKDGTNALVFGWGHTDSFRELGSTVNKNSPRLQYAPVMLLSKARCSADWPSDALRALIHKYMLCSEERGLLNDQGEPFAREDLSPDKDAAFIVIDGVSYMKECGTRRHDMERAKPCVSDGSCICPRFVVDRTRRDDEDGAVPRFVVRNGTVYWRLDADARSGNLAHKALRYSSRGRNVGFCQNDHGAPLVAWAGARLKLIGVASAFLVRPDDTLACAGPYTYMSTHCNGAFIKCVLANKECSEMTKNNLRIAVTTVFLRSSQNQ